MGEVLSMITGLVFRPLGYLDAAGDSERPAFLAIGWATLAGGAALLGVGVLMGIASTTHVYGEEAPALRVKWHSGAVDAPLAVFTF